MKKEYRESEIRAHYRVLTLWLIEQKTYDYNDGERDCRTDRFSDHGYGRLLCRIKRSFCHLLQRGKDSTGGSGGRH